MNRRTIFLLFSLGLLASLAKSQSNPIDGDIENDGTSVKLRSSENNSSGTSHTESRNLDSRKDGTETTLVRPPEITLTTMSTVEVHEATARTLDEPVTSAGVDQGIPTLNSSSQDFQSWIETTPQIQNNESTLKGVTDSNRSSFEVYLSNVSAILGEDFNGSDYDPRQSLYNDLFHSNESYLFNKNVADKNESDYWTSLWEPEEYVLSRTERSTTTTSTSTEVGVRRKKKRIVLIIQPEHCHVNLKEKNGFVHFFG